MSLTALLTVSSAHSGTEDCRRAVTQSEARYANGDTQLAASWITPRDVAHAPAIVILQGSGPSDRKNAWAATIADHLARCGIAVLLTDKRGSGASQGDWRTASMLDLAADGAAGLNWVAQQSGIDHDRLGFLGLSQGGQVAPAAAGLAPDADFVVGWVTSVGPMKSTLLYELNQTYRQHGLNDQQIEALQDMARASFDWLETGRGWDRYLAMRAEIAKGPLAPGVASWPTTQDDSYWTFWRKNAAFDPLPYWREAVDGRGLPGLVVLGEKDSKDNVDVVATTRLLRDGAHGNLHVAVLPEVGHSLRLADGQLHPKALELTVAIARNPKH